jgi:hypothetical protein
MVAVALLRYGSRKHERNVGNIKDVVVPLNMIIDKSSLAVNMKASGCFLMVYKRC